jgi:hypothetical protein
MQSRNPSPAQTAAGQQNSRQSTGPRTCRGKRHSRRNALKHGLYSDVHYSYWEAARELGEDFGEAKTVFGATLAQETEEVLGEYELFLHEHVENTRAARIAAMAPSSAQWAAIVRQQNALHRQMERKIRLLDEMQERRRRLGSATDLLSRLAGQYDPSGDAGGRPAPTIPAADVGAVREPPLPEPTGVAHHTSRRVSSGCMRLSPQTGQERDADMPEDGTSAPPTETTESPRLSPQSEQPRAADMPNSGTSAPPPSGEGLSPAEKTQNRGNEAKKSLKTNELGKTMCAKRTHSCARNASKEAKKAGFRCRPERGACAG